MRNIGKIMLGGIYTAWDGFWLLWLANVLWFVLCLPIITAPAAFAGLYYTMHEMADGESVDWRTFFEGIKLYFWPGLRWFVANLLVLFVLGFYFLFFSSGGNFSKEMGQILSGLPVGLLIAWGIINAFTFPLMLVQEKPSYMTALRNSLVFYVKWPGYTLAFVVFNAAVIALCVWLRVPILIFLGSLTALMACVCVNNKIEETKTAKP
jgi:uncharacterized membrane protein YesL